MNWILLKSFIALYLLEHLEVKLLSCPIKILRQFTFQMLESVRQHSPKHRQAATKSLTLSSFHNIRENHMKMNLSRSTNHRSSTWWRSTLVFYLYVVDRTTANGIVCRHTLKKFSIFIFRNLVGQDSSSPSLSLVGLSLDLIEQNSVRN